MKRLLSIIAIAAVLSACNKDATPDYSSLIIGKYVVSGKGTLSINRISNSVVSVDFTANTARALPSRIVETAYVEQRYSDRYTIVKRINNSEVGEVNLAGTRASVLEYDGTLVR